MDGFTIAVAIATLGVAAVLGWVLDFERRRRRAMRQFARNHGGDVAVDEADELRRRIEPLFDDPPYVGYSAQLETEPTRWVLDLHTSAVRRASESGLLFETQAKETPPPGSAVRRLESTDNRGPADFDALFSTSDGAESFLEEPTRRRIADWASARDWLVEMRWGDGWCLIRRRDRTLQTLEEWEALLELSDLIASADGCSG